jgi:NitT/TauT family transport system substrate-binding protein
VGIEKGFFQEQGISIQFENLGSGAKILEALGSGSIDMGLSSYVPIIYAKNSGIDIKIISGGAVEDSIHKEHAIIVNKESGIDKPSDLKGKKIAINGRRNIDDMILEEYLNKNGLTYDDVKVVEIPFPRMETVLQSGEVDAICSIEPFVTRALKNSTMKLLSYQFVELYPEIPIACYVSTDKWIANNKEQLNKFKIAFDKATEYCINNPDKTRLIISKYTNIGEQEIMEVSLPTFQKNTDVFELQELINKMVRKGLIENKISTEELIHEY